MGIPVFHDDQHGTAIIVAAAVLNGLEFAGKKIADIKIVTSGAGAAALACLNLLVSLGAKAREHLGHRPLRRRLQGPARGDGPLEGPLRQGHAGARAGRRDRRRRRVPRPVGRRRAQARTAEAHGGKAADPGARQPDAGNHAGTCPRGAPGRDDLHRAIGFSQSGQQRALLSLHLPRRARLRRERHQRGDEDGGGARHRRPRPRRAFGCRGPRLFGRDADLRPGFPDPLAFRSAADPEDRAGGGQGGVRERRRDAADRRFRLPMSTSSTASSSAPAW